MPHNIIPEEEKKKLGNPRKVKTYKEFEDKIDEYFHLCEKSGEYPVVSGVAAHLGLSGRSALESYRTAGEKYAKKIDWARGKCKAVAERLLLNPDAKTSAASVIYYLKCFRDEPEFQEISKLELQGGERPIEINWAKDWGD